MDHYAGVVFCVEGSSLRSGQSRSARWPGGSSEVSGESPLDVSRVGEDAVGAGGASGRPRVGTGCLMPEPLSLSTGETNPTPRPDATLDGPLRPACLSDRALSYITWRGAHAGARPRSRTYAGPGTSASAHRQTWGIRVAILARRAIT